LYQDDSEDDDIDIDVDDGNGDSVADNSDVNHMTAPNLALVFGPTLMKSNK